MALDRQIARLAKILVDNEGIPFDEAQSRLRALTLEIVVGSDATSPAAHAAVLTAVSVGSRTFVGGVCVTGATEQRLNSALPLEANTLGEAALLVGASRLDYPPSYRIFIGPVADPGEIWAVSTWWHGWRAGAVEPSAALCDEGDNPLVGIVAGALAVGEAFEAARGRVADLRSEVDLWPVDSGEKAPDFSEVFLPGALWLIGLGNLGQAFLWALAALPYTNPSEVALVLQDRDKTSEENWATSVLVRSETYGELKTKVGEEWALAKKFDVRRVDRRILAGDRLENEDPRLALSGVDKIEARKLMGDVGFDCIVDAGLGKKSADFDRYRVTVFDLAHPIEKHFEGQKDESADESILRGDAYQRLQAEIGRCGTAEIAGASAAAPYVSAVAASVAVARLIAIVSGCKCPLNEVRRLSIAVPRLGLRDKIQGRGLRHAGRPFNTSVRFDEAADIAQ
jgi:hypothetical protein